RRKRTKPRKVDLYDIFCALLYTLKNGYVWRDLPIDFPKWETVYYYWLLWTKTPSCCRYQWAADGSPCDNRQCF
ncbi:transposase, partial [Lactiplantibacillus pentosus]|uniref:transposase n=1 Tax=Lactiplantibacillus pentosus TaxID=1589 RepID=UPI003F53762E